MNEPPPPTEEIGAGSSTPRSVKAPPSLPQIFECALDLGRADEVAGDQQVDVAVRVVVGPGGGVEVEPVDVRSVDQGRGDVRVAVVAVDAQHGVVGLVGLQDVAGDQQVEIAVGVGVAPVGEAPLDPDVEQVAAGEDPAVVAVALDEAGLGVGIDVDQEEVEIAVLVVVGPGALRVGGRVERGGGVGEQPAAGAVRAVVAHQVGRVLEQVEVEDRRDQQVEVAVVVGVGPGERAQVVGVVVGRVLVVAGEGEGERRELPAVVAEDPRRAFGADREVVVAVAVEVAPGEVGGAGEQAVEGDRLGGELPPAVGPLALVDEDQQDVLRADVVDDVVADRGEVEVAIAVEVGRRQRAHPEVVGVGRHEVGIRRRRDLDERGLGEGGGGEQQGGQGAAQRERGHGDSLDSRPREPEQRESTPRVRRPGSPERPEAMVARTAATSSPSVANCAGSTAGWKRTVSQPGRGKRQPLGRMRCEPEMVTGRIGKPSWRAITKPPFLNGSSRPSALRVPSGKKSTETPPASRGLAASRLAIARCASRRSTKTWPIAAQAGPRKGTLRSSCFITQRNWRPR